MTQYGFYYNQKLCTGCRTCQVACKDKNNLEPGIFFRNVHTYETGAYPAPGYYHHSRTCNHCETPACMAVCPMEAYTKDPDTGAVLHDDEKCIGCESCVKECPYGVPQFVEEKSLAIKCDMCFDLTSQGQNPVCVDACVMRALEWGPIDELMAAHPDAVKDIAVLPDSSKTNPSTIIDARPAALDEQFAERFI